MIQIKLNINFPMMHLLIGLLLLLLLLQIKRKAHPFQTW